MNSWYLALSQIKRNPLRSALMAIGIVIAAAVMTAVAILMAGVNESFFQPAIGGYAAGNTDYRYLSPGRRFHRLRDQNIDYRLLKTGGNILQGQRLVTSHLVFKGIDNGCF